MVKRMGLSDVSNHEEFLAVVGLPGDMSDVVAKESKEDIPLDTKIYLFPASLDGDINQSTSASRIYGIDGIPNTTKPFGDVYDQYDSRRVDAIEEGYLIIDSDGSVYLTEKGRQYLVGDGSQQNNNTFRPNKKRPVRKKLENTAGATTVDTLRDLLIYKLELFDRYSLKKIGNGGGEYELTIFSGTKKGNGGKIVEERMVGTIDRLIKDYVDPRLEE